MLVQKTVYPEQTMSYNERHKHIVELLKRNFQQEMKEARQNLGTRSKFHLNKFKNA